MGLLGCLIQVLVTDNDVATPSGTVDPSISRSISTLILLNLPGCV